ncbi:MAG TPA: sigma 54-interacting transcriptional regulator [Kofleriaceae bacterium]
MPSLIIREPGQVAYVVELETTLTAGRDPSAVSLVLADRQVSRKHARIELAGDSWRVVDLESRHGTRVNGVQLAEAKLGDGDVIQLGGVTLIYRSIDQPTTASVVKTLTHVEAPPERATDLEQRRLRMLFDVTRVIASLAGDVDAAVTRVLETTLEVLDCERGVVGLFDRATGAAGRRLAVARGVATVDDVVIPASCLSTMIERHEAVLVRDPLLGTAHSAMGAPLRVGNRTLGYLFVDDRARGRRFEAEDLAFLTALARLAASALEQSELNRRNAALAELADGGTTDLPPLVGNSAAMKQLRAQIAKCAAADATITIHGETGVGKELVALHVHAQSARADQPFVTVNCAAIPEALIESELFGVQRGAFTGADKTRRGRFVLAHRGTLFLDEIGDLALAAQSKLLRAIESGEVQPVGAETVTRVDVRIVAASHKKLADEVKAGRFREDLYYRLDVLELEVPPLRERGDDIALLADYLLARLSEKRAETPELTDDARAALRGHAWPGNVRELRNELERALLLADGRVIDATALRLRGQAASAWTPLEAAERKLLEDGLRGHDGNIQATSRALDVPRNTLYRKLKKYGLR